MGDKFKANFKIALPAALFLLRKRPEDLGLEPLGGQPAAQVGGGDFHLPLGRFFFWLLLVGMLTNGLINAGALGHFPPAMQESHGPAIQAAVISAYSLISIGGKLILGWINDRFGVVVSTTYACILFGLSFVFILLSAQSVAMLYAMAVVFGLGNAIGTVTPPLLTAEVFGKENYGKAYGIVNSFTQVGLSLGSLAVASVYDATGTYRFAWVMLLVLTAVTLVSWVSAVVLSRRSR